MKIDNPSLHRMYGQNKFHLLIQMKGNPTRTKAVVPLERIFLSFYWDFVLAGLNRWNAHCDWRSALLIGIIGPRWMMMTGLAQLMAAWSSLTAVLTCFTALSGFLVAWYLHFLEWLIAVISECNIPVASFLRGTESISSVAMQQFHLFESPMYSFTLSLSGRKHNLHKWQAVHFAVGDKQLVTLWTWVLACWVRHVVDSHNVTTSYHHLVLS